MAYPPSVPPNNRTNGTATPTNHAGDHNDTSDALTDIIDELGSDPKGGYADVEARLDGTVANTIIDAKGDTLVGTAADTIVRQAVGTAGQSLIADSTVTNGIAYASRQDLYLAPTGTVAHTYPRNGSRIVNGTALATGTLVLDAFYAPAGLTITNISMLSGGTAANGPTHWWFGILDSSRVWKRLTADQTSTAWAANTTKTVALSSAWVTTYTGLHYFGVMMSASTAVVTLQGVDAAVLGPTSLVAPLLFGTSNTGMTTPPSEGDTANALAAGSTYIYIWGT